VPERLAGYAQITVVNAVLGEESFGTSPGKALIRATLRTFEDNALDHLGKRTEKYVGKIASAYGLSCKFNYRDCFNATENHEEPCVVAYAAAKDLGLKTNPMETPILWSEDFGQFSKVTKTLMFGLGAGLDQPQLHEPNFDFPDEIICT